MTKKYGLVLLVSTLVVVGGIVYLLQQRSAPQNLVESEGYEEIGVLEGTPLDIDGTDTTFGTTSPSAPATGGGTTKPAPRKPVVVTKAVYDSTITSYRDSGYIFQFSECKLLPRKGTLQIKQGNKFAVQNVGKVAHVITVWNQKITLPPTGYVVLTASTLGQATVACQGGEKATFNVVK
ncbi:MAG TPA: hypothetical protein VEA59_03885 [Patescibacteria group bacterium]|nr:hypothetical protein [Patescibacteria group bacterium]